MAEVRPTPTSAPRATAPGAASRAWTLHRFAIVLATALSVLALFILMNFQPSGFASPDIIPLVLPIAGAVFVLITGRAWAMLTGGILNALFTLVGLFLFGGFMGFFDPITKGDFAAAFLLVLALALSLWGGIRGFLMTRKHRPQPLLRGGWHSTPGLALAMVCAAALVSAATVAYVPNSATGISAVPIKGHETLTAKDFEWGPKNVTVHLRNITDITVVNEDAFYHTLTFIGEDGKEQSMVIDGGETGHAIVFFEKLGTIKFRCIPHSEDYDDSEGMVGNINVVV